MRNQMLLPLELFEVQINVVESRVIGFPVKNSSKSLCGLGGFCCISRSERLESEVWGLESEVWNLGSGVRSLGSGVCNLESGFCNPESGGC